MSKWFSFKRFRLIQPLGFVILFVAMLLPFAFSASGGSHAWIRLPLGFTIQPAEFLKPFMILMVASAVYRTKKKQSLAKEPKKMFRFSLIAMACFFVELIAQKDLGTLSILFVTYVMCIMVLDYRIGFGGHCSRDSFIWGNRYWNAIDCKNAFFPCCRAN